MVVSQFKTDTILRYIQSLDDYSKKKTDEAYGKSVLEKQKICIFNLLENRELEENLLNIWLRQIRAEEEKIRQTSDKEIAANLNKLKSPELNLEYVFKKDIQVIKSDLKGLFRIYELQKDITGEKYLQKVQEEIILIADLKKVLNNIINSHEQIELYLKNLSVLSTDNYMDLNIPSNIELVDPISRYDLEPFLAAYKDYANELSKFHIQLMYSSMTADFMRSQYTKKSMFQKPIDRTYILLISNNRDEKKGITMTRLSFDDKKGWFAHELKHILSYTMMSAAELRKFTAVYGFRWALSYIPGLKKIGYKYLDKVEGETHDGAISHKSGYELAKGTDYFFNKSNTTKSMKERYAKVYPKEHEVMDRTSKEYFDSLNRQRRPKN